jgi:AraC-like DNA-binding protein
MELVSVKAEGAVIRERLSVWDARLWRAFLPVQTQAIGNQFEGEARFASVGLLHLVRITADRHRVERLIDEQRGVSGLVQLIVQRKGSAQITQFGREAILAPGEWTICDADRPFVVASGDESEQIILLLPRDRVTTGANDLALHAARTFGEAGVGGTARLLPSYLATLFDEIGAVEDSACDELVDMAAQLARLALSEARRSIPTVTRRETLRLRVKDYIRRNLRDPALSIDRVANAFRCTKRHLHKVFSEDATTLNQFIWAERLNRCRESLSNPSLMRHSITEVAFMWGFNNSAHFSKAFKERFGSPPGIFRAIAREKAVLAGAVH